MTNEVFGVQGRGPKADRFLTRAVRGNGLVFTTLHHGYDAADYDPALEAGTLPSELATQTRGVLTLLEGVLAEAGTSLENVLRVTVFLDSDQAGAEEEVAEALAAFFGERGISRLPVRTTIHCELTVGGVAMDMIAAT